MSLDQFWSSALVAVIITSIALFASTTAAQPPAADQKAPPGGTPLVVDPVTLVGPSRNDHGQVEVASVSGPGFDRAIRFSVTERGQEWDVSVNLPVERELKKGEAVLLGIWGRMISTRNESGQGLIHYHLSESRGPWREIAGSTVTLTEDWTHFYARGVCTDDFAPGQFVLKLFAGQVEQVIEIGGIELLSYGTGFDVQRLPRTRPTYEGRAMDAPWRQAAAKRIEEHRTAPLAVRVLGADGRPVNGAQVRVQLVRNAFDFGIQTSAREMLDEGARGEMIRRRFPELFNAATFGNDLKWPAWVGEWGPSFSHEGALRALRWFEANDIRFRGHVLVWPSADHLPTFMDELLESKADPKAMQALVLSHIDDITGATGDLVQEWDVINEPFDNHELMDAGGREVMVEWFQRARERLPHAGLALNEYSLLTPLVDTPKQAAHEQTVRFLLESDAPLTVLGLQGHFGGTVPGPERMLQSLDRFAKLGLPMRVTEFDVGGDDEDLQADFTRDALITLYSHPRVVGWQTWWGLNRFLNDDGSLTRIGQVYDDLVNGEWKTDEMLSTDNEGNAQTRGHLGRYRITVTRAERTAETWLDLRPDTEPVIVTLP